MRPGGNDCGGLHESVRPRSPIPSPLGRFPAMLLVIDNYDSFTFNLVQHLGALGTDPVVIRNDEATLDEVDAMNPTRIVVSPGPCTPSEAGISVDAFRVFGPRGVPMLGVCLGHQSLVQHYGGEIISAQRLMHGKTSAIEHDGEGLFSGLSQPCEVGRYHSLAADREQIPEVLAVTARTADAADALRSAFAGRTVTKIYLALTRDRPRSDSPLDGPIARHPVHRQRMAVVAEGKAAITHYKLLSATPQAHLWAIRIETGRTHQIRVHFAAAGAPVLGDGTYARRKLASAAPRQMLHAWQLSVPHPQSGEPLVCTAPLPDDFVKVAVGLGIDLDVLAEPGAIQIG